MADYHNLDYSYLVLATGADINYHHIPELKQNGLVCKTLRDIKMLKQIPSGDIIIIGGGVCGVELAAQLALMLKDENIKIFEARSRILPDLDAGLRKKAEQRLRKLGVEIFTNRRLQKVEKDKIIFGNNQILHFDNLIWAGGLNLGRYKVDKYLQVKGEENVFAIGDCASALPGMIRSALDQAKIAALNIKNSINSQPLVAYKPKFKGIVIPLGGWQAIGKVGKIKVSGFIAWLIKKSINFIYIKTYGKS